MFNHTKRMRLLVKKYLLFLKSNFELAFWLLAIIGLFFLDTNGQSLCMVRFLGIAWCPGCGLGHAMNAALHFDVVTSFKEHPFGIPALLIIAHRIKALISKPTLHYEQ